MLNFPTAHYLNCSEFVGTPSWGSFSSAALSYCTLLAVSLLGPPRGVALALQHKDHGCAGERGGKTT